MWQSIGIFVTKLTEFYNPRKQARNEIAVHLSSYLLTAIETKSDVAKMNSADSQPLVDYLQGWHVTNSDSMDILNDSGNKKNPLGPQDCKTRHTIVKYSC